MSKLFTVVNIAYIGIVFFYKQQKIVNVFECVHVRVCLAIVHVELAARAVAGGGRARADAAAARVPRGARLARPRPAAGRVARAPRAAPRHARRPQARQARALHRPGTVNDHYTHYVAPDKNTNIYHFY